MYGRAALCALVLIATFPTPKYRLLDTAQFTFRCFICFHQRCPCGGRGKGERFEEGREGEESVLHREEIRAGGGGGIDIEGRGEGIGS